MEYIETGFFSGKKFPTTKRNNNREYNSRDIKIVLYKKRTIMSLQCYGYLLGKIKLIKDTHRDEVFIEETQLIVMRNNIWLFEDFELVAIANELIGDDE